MDIKEFKTKSKILKNLMIESFKIKNVKEITTEIKENTMYSIVTQKSINPYGFLLWIIEKYGVIEELHIATYRISEKATLNLKSLLEDKQILKFTLLVNDNYETLMKDKAILLINLNKENDNFKLMKKSSHAKVTLVKTKNEYIVISGSGNYSNNPKIEQYTIMNSKELYNFNKEWMDDGYS